MRNDEFQNLLEQAREEGPTPEEGDTRTSPLEVDSDESNSSDRQPPATSSASPSSSEASTSHSSTSDSSSNEFAASSETLATTLSSSSSSSSTASSTASTSTSSSSSSSSPASTDTDTIPKTCVEQLCYESNASVGINSLYLVDFNAFAVLLPRDNQDMRVTRVEFYTGYIVGRHNIQIHEDSQGRPGTIKGSGEFQASILQGWQGSQISPPVELGPANPHWINWRPGSGSLGSMASIFGGQEIPGMERSTFDPGWSASSRLLKMRVYCCNY